MAGKQKTVPPGFGELEQLLKVMGPNTAAALGAAGLERVDTLKGLRKKLTKARLDVAEVDAELELWQGTKERKGLLMVLDVQEEKVEEDPNQTDIEDKPDMATWDKTTDQVRELVSGIVSDHKPVAAIRMLNNLEDGEKQRKGGHRESVLKVIGSARRPLVAKVEKIETAQAAKGVN